jgi:hypothetical protein
MGALPVSYGFTFLSYKPVLWTLEGSRDPSRP